MYMLAIMGKLPTVRVTISHLWQEGMTNDSVAQETGLNKNTISSYRSGAVRQPRIDILIALQRFFAKELNRDITLQEMIKIIDET